MQEVLAKIICAEENYVVAHMAHAEAIKACAAAAKVYNEQRYAISAAITALQKTDNTTYKIVKAKYKATYKIVKAKKKRIAKQRKLLTKHTKNSLNFLQKPSYNKVSELLSG